MKACINFLIRNRRWLATLLVLIVTIVCTAIGVIQGIHSQRYYSEAVAELNDGWSAEDGTPMLLSDLPHGAVTVHHSTDDLDFHEKRLCTKSVDTFFEVLADGEVIYSYFPEQSSLLGESYGMYIHAIPVPEDVHTLTIKLTPIFSDAPPALLDTVIEDAGMFIGDIFNEGLSGFCICLLILLLGGIMTIIGIYSPNRNDVQQIEFLTLGSFAILVALWSVNDTLILQTITQNPAVVRLMNYITLIFLPYPVVSFIANATNNRKSLLVPLLFLIVCANFLINVTLTALNISDYFHLVKISQGIIVFALGMTAYFVISAMRKRQVEKRFLRIFIIGIGALAIGAGVDLVRFRATDIVLQTTSIYARMGSLVFLLLIGLYLVGEYHRTQAETGRTLALLAYTDGLTGLKNRIAFNEAEQSLQNQPDAACLIIQFDINNLKKVNDVYGHAEGDRHISNAARIIRESVGDRGECYRTGGDEFIAILHESENEAAAQAVIRQMEQQSAEYNKREDPPVHLDIAYGTAVFRASEGTLENAELLADQRMYECKRAKKARA